jgi:SAM-dependent methyltransferase
MRLGEPVLRAANAVFRTTTVRRLLSVPRATHQNDLGRYYDEMLRDGASFLDVFEDDGDVVGKRVLDLGCALGGRSLAIAGAGARQVVGIDIDIGKIRRARREAERRGLGSATFAVQDAHDPGLLSDCFDVVLMLDVAEHVDDLTRVLVGAARLVAHGGRILVAFPPYRSPWGAHLFVHLPVPWVHLLFDDADVLDLWRKIHLECTARGGAAVSGSRARAIIDAARTTELWDLNGLTIEEFETRVRDARLRLRNVGFKVPGGIGKVVARVPRLRELVVTRVTAVLEPR